MERTERLLDLVATLLDAEEPVSLARLRELFSDYRGHNPESGLRAFERDKAELGELGLPVRFVKGDSETPGGYQLDRDAYYLPEIHLRAEEWALLYAAGGAALGRGDFPGSRDLFYALRKIAFTREGALVPQFSDAVFATGLAGRPTGPLAMSRRLHLERLWTAVHGRKYLQFAYRNGEGVSSRRRLECYGVAFRRGQWLAIGHDTKRDSVRTFRVDRMSQVRVNAVRPRTPDFDVPSDFRLDQHLQAQTWELPVHAPETVVLAVDPTLSPLAPRLFPGARITAGGSRVELKVTHREALVRQVLALGPRAQVLSPPGLRRQAKQLLIALRRSVRKPALR